MIRSLLNSLSTVEIVLLVIGGAIVLAVAFSVAIRKLVPDIAEREFETVANGLRVIYELLFALILAFVIASVLDKFNDAEATVDTEATALAQLVRDNWAFPAGVQSEINAGIQRYIEATIRDEWPAMREGRSSLEAAAALDTIYSLYQNFEPAPGVPRRFYDQALDHLEAVAGARRERLGISGSGLPTILVLMLPLGCVLMLVLEYRPNLTPRSQAVFMSALALVLSSTYLLTILLDYPFSGDSDVSISNEPLSSGVLAYLAGDEPRHAERDYRQGRLTPQALTGVWSSETYGTVALRRVGREVRGAYRFGDGTVLGAVSRDGVFRGTWCEGGKRARTESGLVDWRLYTTPSGERLIRGSWGYGERKPDGSFAAQGGWDLHRLKIDTAPDLTRRVRSAPRSAYCRATR